MRTSVAGPVAAHLQRQAILSRHEDTREALAQIGARSGVAARFREVAFPMASVKEHQDGNVCATEHPLRRKCVAAPSTQALLPRPDCSRLSSLGRGAGGRSCQSATCVGARLSRSRPVPIRSQSQKLRDSSRTSPTYRQSWPPSRSLRPYLSARLLVAYLR